MAADPGRTQDDMRRRIAAERDELARAVADLRGGMGRATDVSALVRRYVVPAAAAAAGTGFLIGGGLGATISLVAVRRRVRRERGDRSLLRRLRA